MCTQESGTVSYAYLTHSELLTFYRLTVCKVPYLLLSTVDLNLKALKQKLKQTVARRTWQVAHCIFTVLKHAVGRRRCTTQLVTDHLLYLQTLVNDMMM